MKTLSKNLLLAGGIILCFNTNAVAGKYPVSPWEQYIEEIRIYWEKKHQSDFENLPDKAMQGSPVSDKTECDSVKSSAEIVKSPEKKSYNYHRTSEVSQYPCKDCNYDFERGGYVPK